MIMITNLIYKKWPNEELFGHLMLQYDLKQSNPDDCIDIPFQIVEWCGCSNDSMWNEVDTEVQIMLAGTIIFEGVRHCNFAPNDKGYVNYPNIINLSRCLYRIHELCIKYCHSYVYYSGNP